MLPLFRKIRWKLAKDNNFFKYSRYAIGEIVLVVIGILIALQINNWNEIRINRKHLTTLLQGVKWDLEKDTFSINQKIKELENKNVERKQFLNHPDYNSLSIDSLEKSLETFTKDITIIDKSFQQIQNSNITNYGDFKETIEQIQYFYVSFVPLLMDNTDGHLRDIERQDSFWRYQQTSYELHYFDDLKSYQSDEVATPLKPLLITVDSDEAASYMETDEQVLSANLSVELCQWLERFVLTHYQPEEPKKRRRKQWHNEEQKNDSKARK